MTRSQLVPAVLLAVASFVLRLSMLGRYLHYDESYSCLHYATDTLWNAIHTYSAPNNHVFHSLCMWLSTHALGLSVVASRLPAFVFGVALVPLTYLLGREVTGPIGSLVAAALTGGCDILVTYSVEARGYGVQAALFVAALVLVPRLVRQPTAMLAGAFAVLLSLAIFTIPTLVYGVLTPFVSGTALACAQSGGRGRRVSWLAAAGVLAGFLTAALYTPALLYVRNKGMDWGNPLEPRPLLSLYGDLSSYFLAGLPKGVGVGVLLVVTAGAVVDAWPRRQLPLAVAWVGVPLGALALQMTLTERPPFARNFVFMIPLLFVLCGRSIDSALSLMRSSAQPLAERAALLVAAGTFLWTASSTYARYSDTMKFSGSSSHYLFENVVRRLQVGDDFFATNEVMIPIQLYALIAGVPLATPRGSWPMGNTQRTAPDGARARSLSSPSQRFFLLAKEPDDRKRIPRKLQAEVRRGRYRWIERRRFRSNADQYATLWELALSGQATWAPLEELRRARHDHSRTLR